MYLYNDLGALVDPAGIINNPLYYASGFTPGQTFSLEAKNTKHYFVTFGGTGRACTDKPAYGKIVVENDAGLILASGETRGIEGNPLHFHTDIPIIINNGQPF